MSYTVSVVKVKKTPIDFPSDGDTNKSYVNEFKNDSDTHQPIADIIFNVLNNTESCNKEIGSTLFPSIIFVIDEPI